MQQRLPPELGFAIGDKGPNARAARAAGFSDFPALARHVEGLPYGRPLDEDDIAAVLHEQRGTCSGKHRLLAAVARECGQHQVELVVGIYAMNETNTPGVGEVLSGAGVDTIPEAHCYLRVGAQRFDFTGVAAGSASPFDALLTEQVISPAVLPEAKRRLHEQAISDWAAGRDMTFGDAWALREACIAALADDRDGIG